MQPMLETGNYDKESFCLSHENLKCYKKIHGKRFK